MKPSQSDTSQPGRGRCAACSNEAASSCAGCLGAPAYGNGQPPQRTFYCTAQCQKAHWSTHKAECKLLQTRKLVFRAATVLDAMMAVVDAKEEKAMIWLAGFLTELFKGIAVTVEEVTAIIPANGATSTRPVYKVTLNSAPEAWAIDPKQAYPPSLWLAYIRVDAFKIESIKPLGFHRHTEGGVDPVTRALERQIATIVATRDGNLGSLLKASESAFKLRLQQLVEEVRSGADSTSAEETQSSLSIPAQVPANKLYHIRPLPGKGQAMVAAGKIPKGTCIIAESPTITIPGSPHDPAGVNQLITSQLSNLPAATRRQYYTLHNHYATAAPPIPPAVGIARTNALPFGHNSLSGGIFLHASRINHSCTHNAENTWNASLGKLKIYAIRDIKPGSEITISYIEGFKPYNQRQAHFLSAFGFRCVCERCEVTDSKRKESDDRLRRLVQLEEEIGDGVGIVATPLACLRKAREMLRLLNEEGLGGSTVARAYYDAFQVAIANGDQARAKVFAKRCYASRVMVAGEDSEDAAKAKEMMKRPAEHRLFGTTMKWKQAAGKVPSGLSEEAFENWLWREKGTS
ncbi:hypothetical protein B0T18DRAFT_366186 [Schizothecium vesticola]|uniref:MYND-type zinc finger protein samB n=1 Tax=Schizothecium vesticola TaxID=314040 RepID=A0AA40K8N5_9PEZI|nr:hypothetical protein B0T18DRAFT_366186 [Schizothecium vesticola]